MKQFLTIIFSITMLFITGCGKDSKSSTTVNVPPQQENPTPPNGSGGTTPPRNTCMSSTQRKNITTVMNRISDFSSITGTGTGAIRNPDGTVSTFPVSGTVDVNKLSDTSWQFTSSLCDISPACTVTEVWAFNNDCLEIAGQRASILSTSSSNIRASTTQSNSRVIRGIGSSNDKLRWSFRVTEGGVTQSSVTFEEN